MPPEPKKPPEDPFDIAGAEDRAAKYLDDAMDGKASDSDYWDAEDED